MNTILIVDDQPDIRRLLQVTLSKSYNIVQAEDGMTAMEAVRQHRPKIILLDVMMPGEMDGLQVLEKIKGDPQTRNILVAILSARGQTTDQEDARKRGADAYFVKPFSPLHVVGWIKSKLP